MNINNYKKIGQFSPESFEKQDCLLI